MRYFLDVLRTGVLWGAVAGYLYALWLLGGDILTGHTGIESHAEPLLGDIGTYAIGGVLLGVSARTLQLLHSRSRGGPPHD